jgi:Fe-S cluster assembly ATPase SufC
MGDRKKLYDKAKRRLSFTKFLILRKSIGQSQCTIKKRLFERYIGFLGGEKERTEILALIWQAQLLVEDV